MSTIYHDLTISSLNDKTDSLEVQQKFVKLEVFIENDDVTFAFSK